MRRAFERAKARGEVREDIDLDLFAPALAGIVQYRSMVLGEPLTEQLAERVLDQIILPAATRGPDPKDRPPMTKTKHYGWALALISTAQLMVILDATIINIAIPHIQTDLGF